jgi:hypothetical protein
MSCIAPTRECFTNLNFKMSNLSTFYTYIFVCMHTYTPQRTSAANQAGRDRTTMTTQNSARHFHASKPQDALDLTIKNARAATELIHVQKELTFARLAALCKNPPNLHHIIELKLAGNSLSEIPHDMYKVRYQGW